MTEVNKRNDLEVIKNGESVRPDRVIITELFKVAHFAEILSVLAYNYSNAEDTIPIPMNMMDQETLFDLGILKGYRANPNGKSIVRISDELTDRGEALVAMVHLDDTALAEGKIVPLFDPVE